jgi:hypothetical protein
MSRPAATQAATSRLVLRFVSVLATAFAALLPYTTRTPAARAEDGSGFVYVMTNGNGRCFAPLRNTEPRVRESELAQGRRELSKVLFVICRSSEIRQTIWSPPPPPARAGEGACDSAHAVAGETG